MAKTPLYKGTPYPKPPCEFYVCSPLKINKSIFQEIAGANSQGSSLKPRGKGRGKEDTAVRGPTGCNLLPGLGPPAPLKEQAQCSHVPVPKLPASSSSATHTPLPSLIAFLSQWPEARRPLGFLLPLPFAKAPQLTPPHKHTADLFTYALLEVTAPQIFKSIYACRRRNATIFMPTSHA